MWQKNIHLYDFYTNFLNKDNISYSNSTENLMTSRANTPKEKLHLFSPPNINQKINYSSSVKNNFIPAHHLHMIDNGNPFNPSLMTNLSTTQGETKRKKTLILDIDETLVHSSFFPFISAPDISLNLKINDLNKIIYVLKRPYVDEFLKELSNIFEIITFTASISQYASPLLDQLDKYKIVSYRLFRQHCKYENGIYIKELSKIGRPLQDVIIIDNNPMSYIYNIDNGIPILTWYENQKDDELMKLIPLLKYLSKVDDVRPVIRQVVDRKMNSVDFNKVNQIIYGNSNISNKIDVDKDNNIGLLHYKDISSNIINSLSNMSNNEYKKYFGNIDLNSKQNTIISNNRNISPIVNTINDFNNLNSNNNNLNAKKMNKRKILYTDIKQSNQKGKPINKSRNFQNKDISFKNNLDIIKKNLGNDLNNNDQMNPNQSIKKIYNYINNSAINNSINNNNSIINNINGNVNISINVNNINNINNNIIDNTLKYNTNINKNISLTKDNIILNSKLNKNLADNLNNNISSNKNDKIIKNKIFNKNENNNKKKNNNNNKYLKINSRNKNINNNNIKADNINKDKNLNNEKNNNKKKSNNILNKISFNNQLKSNKKKIKNKIIDKKNFPEDTSLNSVACPKNNKVPNDSDNKSRYSANNQLNKFNNNKKEENYNSLNYSVITNDNDGKNNLRKDIKLINVNFNNEMTVIKKSKSLPPKNKGNMNFLKDKLNPDTKKIKVKERRVKKRIKYLNLKEFNKLIIKNNRSNKKIVNRTQNLNIHIKNLTIDINQLSEKKKGLIHYNKNRAINNKKRFIDKDLSIDTINLNIPGKNDNSSENNINIKKNLNEKKMLNYFETEHKYRISSPALNIPINSDYIKYHITDLNKSSDIEQKLDLDSNKKANILSRSQDNYKKIEKIKISKPKEENCLEKNSNTQEYKYNEKTSKKSICRLQ